MRPFVVAEISIPMEQSEKGALDALAKEIGDSPKSNQRENEALKENVACHVPISRFHLDFVSFTLRYDFLSGG